MQQHLICIHCPKGCKLEVEMKEGTVIRVTGNTCPRGEAYAQKEMTNPTRMITTTIAVRGGIEERLPVKTDGEIPKSKMISCAKALTGLVVDAPIQIGDCIVQNINDTGISIVATKSIAKKSLDS